MRSKYRKKHTTKNEQRATSTFFKITSVCRADLLTCIEEGRASFSKEEVMSLTDAEMRELAGRMCDAYCDCCFWTAAEQIAEDIISDKNKKLAKKSGVV